MSENKRTPIITANWKMYKTLKETEQFIDGIVPLVKSSPAHVLIAVPFTGIHTAAEKAKGSSIRIGAQNMNDSSEGAFTGEIAAKMLVDAGATFVLIGHSERRHIFKENNAFINRKVKRAIDAGLQPILCIGETLMEREGGETEEILATQISECLHGLDSKILKDLIIAYEPVWAIGSGIPATPEIAQETHHFCREYLAQHWGTDFASLIPLLYGGSVKPDTASTLLIKDDIDGLLVGGASLDVTSFAAIVNAAANH